MSEHGVSGEGVFGTGGVNCSTFSDAVTKRRSLDGLLLVIEWVAENQLDAPPMIRELNRFAFSRETRRVTMPAMSSGRSGAAIPMQDSRATRQTTHEIG